MKQSEHRSRAKAPSETSKTSELNKTRELSNEKDLSAEQPPAQKNARISRADGNAGGPQRDTTTATQGPDATDGIDSAETARLARKIKGPKAFGFGSDNRLHKSHDFQRIQREGKRIVAGRFVILAAMNTARSKATSIDHQDPESSVSNAPRLGVTVSRRIGNAVVRNRVKRRIRECFRTILKPMIADGTDIVVIAREGAAEVSFDAMRQALERATLELGNRLK